MTARRHLLQVRVSEEEIARIRRVAPVGMGYTTWVRDLVMARVRAEEARHGAADRRRRG